MMLRHCLQTTYSGTVSYRKLRFFITEVCSSVCTHRVFNDDAITFDYVTLNSEIGE